MSTSESFDDTFNFIVNGKDIGIEADVISKTCVAAANYLSRSIFQIKLGRVSEKAEEILVSALKGETFDVTPETAAELSRIGKKWQIQSLIDQSKDVIVRDDLSVLFEHIDNEDNLDEILNQIVPKINTYMKDERFEMIPPEIVFRLILLADSQDLDQECLIEYIMKMYEIQPTTAVPLILLIDFDRLNSEQQETIFQTRSTHELSIGYFIAQSLSTATNMTANMIKNASDHENTNIESIRTSLRDQVNQSQAEVEKSSTAILQELNSQLQKQQEQLDKLMSDATRQRDRQQREMATNSEGIANLHKKVQALDETVASKSSQIDDQSQKLQDEITEQLDQVGTGISQSADNSREALSAKYDDLVSTTKSAIEEERQRLLAIQETVSEREEGLKQTADEVVQLQALMSAKVIRDELRFDSLNKKVSNRFKVFEDPPGFWNLNRRQVEDAEQQIKKLEEEIDRVCPLRGKAGQGADAE